MSGFISQNDFAKLIKKTKSSVKSYREKHKIPCLSRGSQFYIPVDFEDIIALRSEITKMRCEVITLGNNKGGVGKTTLVANLGSLYAFYGFKVLLIDMDTQSNLTRQFNIKCNENNIINAINNKCDINESIVKIKSKTYQFGSLDIVPNNPLMMNDFNELKDEMGIEKIISPIKKDYNIILIDTPPTINSILTMSLMASNSVLIALNTDYYSNIGLVNFLNSVINIKDVNILGGIVNSFKKNVVTEKANLQTLEENFKKHTNNSKLLTPYLSNSTIFNEVSTNLSFTLLEHSPNHKLLNELMGLSLSILDTIFMNQYREK